MPDARAPFSWAATTFSAFNVRDFRLFYVGQTLSLTGSWMRRTAMGWLVYELTGSMTMLGTIFALTLFPMTLLSPIAGLIADRVDKRRIILCSVFVSMLATTSLAVLVYADMIQTWHLMVIATIIGTAFAFEVPARQAFVVEIVGRDKLMNAIALNSANVNLTRILGPVLAGFLMAKVGMAACFAIDALSYTVVIATLLMMRIEPRKIPPRKEHPVVLLREGLREVMTNPPVRMVMGLLAIILVFGWSFQNLMAGIAQKELGLSEWQYGVLVSLFGIGAVCGALFVASRSNRNNATRHLLISMAIMAIGLFAFSFSDLWISMEAPAWALWSLMAVPMMMAGFGGVMFLSTGNTLVQLSVADDIRGRVMGIWSIGWGSAFPLGGLVMGMVADMITAMWTIRISSVLLALACVWSASFIRRRIARRAASMDSIATSRITPV
jgi:MFS family permease